MNHNEQQAFLAGCKHTRENIKTMSVPEFPLDILDSKEG